MKERPILFNGEMVRAILNGDKTQTRRPVVELGNAWHIDRLLGDWPLSQAPEHTPTGAWVWELQTDVDDSARYIFSCPFGVPGDQLWVRETWAACRTYQGEYPAVAYKATGDIYIGNEKQPVLSVMAGKYGLSSPDSYGAAPKNIKWRPSILMPRWASRITLEVTDVRAERVQEIDRFDAIAEGIRWTISDKNTVHVYEASKQTRERFRELWDSIYAKKGLGWDVNPWVWVVMFRMVSA